MKPLRNTSMVSTVSCPDWRAIASPKNDPSNLTRERKILLFDGIYLSLNSQLMSNMLNLLCDGVSYLIHSILFFALRAGYCPIKNFIEIF